MMGREWAPYGIVLMYEDRVMVQGYVGLSLIRRVGTYNIESDLKSRSRSMFKA